MDLGQWRATDRISQNTVAILVTVAVMATFVGAEHQGDDRVVFLRASAAAMIVLHSVLHVAMLRALDVMVRSHFPGAEHALAIYRDPCRLSHLDLAAIWLAFFVLVPLVFPMDTSAVLSLDPIER